MTFFIGDIEFSYTNEEPVEMNEAAAVLRDHNSAAVAPIHHKQEGGESHE